MRKITLILISLALAACTAESAHEFKPGDPDLRPDEPEVPAATGADSLIDARLFEVINLDYPGLENAKKAYSDGKLYAAAGYILGYYRSRTDIFNPAVNILSPSYTATEESIANQATADGGWRFYIRNYSEGTGTDGLPLYYSFAKEGGIDWDYAPEGMQEQEYFSQKHRHQWMLTQAKVYAATGDEKYIQAWKSAYGDWLTAYPCPEGKTSQLQWTGLQTSERAIDQPSILQYYIKSENFTPEWLSIFLVAYHSHIASIIANWYEPVTSNIRLSQEQAVTMAGILMPEFKDSPQWLSTGTAAIGAQASIQFNEDGVQNELDPSYHIGVVADFINLYKLARANDKLNLFPEDYISRLHGAARFVMDIIYPNFSLDNFNDTRSASWTKGVLGRNLRSYSEMFPDDEELRWYASGRASGKEPTSYVQSYPVSGYDMLRDGWKESSMMLVLKNNYNPENKWHCQPDNNTIGLYRNGRRFLPDAGVYTYGGSAEDNANRLIYRSTEMHNTLTKDRQTIDSQHQKGRLVKQATNGATEILVSENDSYSDLSHRRSIFFVDHSFFVLVDEGYGSGSGFPVNLNFKLCEGKNNSAIDETLGDGIYGAHTIFTDGNNMLFRTWCETTDGYLAENNTGYYSDNIGQRTQRRWYRVSVDKKDGLAARFITVIYPFGAESEIAGLGLSAQFTDNAGGTAGTFHQGGCSVRVTVKGKTYDLSYTL